MDGANKRQMETLEDQLRRMIVSGNATNGAYPPPNQATHPTVRLPPRASENQTQTFHGAPAPGQAPTRHTWDRPSYPAGSPTPLSPHPRRDTPPWNHSRPAYDAPQFGLSQNHQQPLPSTGHHQRHPGYSNGTVPHQFAHAAPQQRQRNQQQLQLDPNAFQRLGSYGPQQPMGRGRGGHHLFNAHQSNRSVPSYIIDQSGRQAQYLESIVHPEVARVSMHEDERNSKEAFRVILEQICREICKANSERLPNVSLKFFGSFQSGFATAGSDMDLAMVVENTDAQSSPACFSLLELDLPRALEKRLLQLGYGAHLLTRTRVPIIKICEKPTEVLIDQLREEREKWDALPHEQKYPHLHPGDNAAKKDEEADKTTVNPTTAGLHTVASLPEATEIHRSEAEVVTTEATPVLLIHEEETTQEASSPNNAPPQQRQPPPKSWTRERKAGPLDFPKTGVGIQCDINFFNPLGLHNTQLLRCYSLCDVRVRPMILFVKAWAKRRKINSSYSGTLSSYGYVLMVMHFLMNVAQPGVIPNLQHPWRPTGNQVNTDMSASVVDGWDVAFWCDENEITQAAARRQLTANQESLGSLLAGFFQYYSSQGPGPQFRWTTEVLSLRTPGGIVLKNDKGWVKAVTEEGEGRRIQHRYLFCIEDPFELNHNVARTVTHNGIVAIRDEFRRARALLHEIGTGMPLPREGLLDNLLEAEELRQTTEELKAQEISPQAGLDATIDNLPTHSQSLQSYHSAGLKNKSHALPPVPRNAPGRTQPPNTNQINVHDIEAFPSLGPSASKSSKRNVSGAGQGNFSEISGDKAQTLLSEIKRKKDERHAESVAMESAEAVLGDSE